MALVMVMAEVALKNGKGGIFALHGCRQAEITYLFILKTLKDKKLYPNKIQFFI